MEALFDGQFNIDYGTRMLAGLINKHGDLREALFAYGPMDIGYRYADTVLSIYQNYQD
jgi:soluble lytic murein transglycosylase-like protein